MLTKSATSVLLGQSRRLTRVGFAKTVRSVSFLSLEDDLDTWPRARKNTILNVCSEGIVLSCLDLISIF
jgi:hypothetical protein